MTGAPDHHPTDGHWPWGEHLDTFAGAGYVARRWTGWLDHAGVWRTGERRRGVS